MGKTKQKTRPEPQAPHRPSDQVPLLLMIELQRGSSAVVAKLPGQPARCLIVADHDDIHHMIAMRTAFNALLMWGGTVESMSASSREGRGIRIAEGDTFEDAAWEQLLEQLKTTAAEAASSLSQLGY